MEEIEIILFCLNIFVILGLVCVTFVITTVSQLIILCVFYIIDIAKHIPHFIKVLQGRD
jgi:hypothetical protein